MDKKGREKNISLNLNLLVETMLSYINCVDWRNRVYSETWKGMDEDQLLY